MNIEEESALTAAMVDEIEKSSCIEGEEAQKYAEGLIDGYRLRWNDEYALMSHTRGIPALNLTPDQGRKMVNDALARIHRAMAEADGEDD